MSELRDRPVSEIMQTQVSVLGCDEHLDLVDDIMKYGRIRHMPVLKEGRLVGILSNRDLLAASLSQTLDFGPKQRRTFLRSVDVSEVMKSDVVTIAPTTPIGEAARVLLDRKIGCLPVVNDEDELVGLVTETDLLRASFSEAPGEKSRAAS